jgi:hypothetical protein
MHDIKMRSDVYLLPPPKHLAVLTLGYKAATVDLLWAKLLVEQGIHALERRAFPDLENYLDSIVELEPTYKPLYKYVDSLLAFRPPRGFEKDARRARDYLDRGLRERPMDPDVHQYFGDFVAFLGPSFLSDPAERDQWKRDGAHALMRAAELGGDRDRTRVASAVTLLGERGEREAAIRHLRTGLALTDDPDEQQHLLAKLQRLEASQQKAEIEQHLRIIDAQWQAHFPGVSRTAFLLLGPVFDPVACAGLEAARTKECSLHWPRRFQEEEP